MYKYPDQLGYICNKKGAVSSTVSGETVMYVLSTKTCDNGKQLIIKTSKGTDKLKESNTIIPILPYRLIINDYSFLKKIEQNLIQYADSINFYNPGITVTDKINLPSILSNNTSKFIELNIPRDGLKYFSNNYVYQTFSSTNNIAVTIRNIDVYDTQASMVLENISPTEDILYISIVTRVDISGTTSDTYYANKVLSYSYCIPIVISLKINRTNLITDKIINTDILPYSWSYIIDYNQFNDNTPVTIGKINSSEIGSIDTKMWNYNIIPGKYLYSSTYRNRYDPIAFGCNVDICLDLSNIITAISSYGNFYLDVNKYNQAHIFTRCSLGLSSGFVLCSYYYSKNRMNTLSSKINIYKYNTYYISIFNTYINSNKELHFYILDDSFNILSRCVITNGYDGDLLISQGYVYLTYSSNNKRYIFKLSTDISTLVSIISYKVTTGESFKNLFLSSNATLIAEQTINIKESNLFDYNVTIENIYKIDKTSQDKSIGNLNNTFIGDYYYLNSNGSNYLILDKVSLSSYGVTNVPQFINI
ncbi:MAG: hypothetical protein M0R17_02535 [Candidatus Omnitrophica bacterium]|jgi:hypothetical protein|nr:hypothetical protein [Candidatus Omnitrophota bacterium]